MAAGPDRSAPSRWQSVRAAFGEFLTVPLLVIAGFLALAVATLVLDKADSGPPMGARRWLTDNLFRSPEGVAQLLSTTASSIITITSITFSLLLVAVQQTATSLTTQVFDQFLRRRTNQVYFGFFVGAGVYSLVQLAGAGGDTVAVVGATVSLVTAIVATVLLLVLARLLVRSARTGFLDRVDVELLEAAYAEAGGGQVVLRFPVGSYVAYGDAVAEVRAADGQAAEALARSLDPALHLERQRYIDHVDAAYGIEQLERMGWTSISTAHHNVVAGVTVVLSLRDVVARWAPQLEEVTRPADAAVVYPDDVMAKVLQTFESLSVAAAESMQQQTLSQILLAVATLLDRLPPPYDDEAVALLQRMVRDSLERQLRTAQLSSGLAQVAAAVDATGRSAAAAEFRRQAGSAHEEGELQEVASTGGG